MDIKKLQADSVAKTAKFFQLALSARTQPQINAANKAESIAARAAVKLAVAKAASLMASVDALVMRQESDDDRRFARREAYRS